MKDFLKKNFQLYFLALFFEIVYCETDPIITSWKKSNGTGYNGITADVDKVQYTADYVYVHTSGIPSYSIGPWGPSPNIPTSWDATYTLPRKPTVPTTKMATPMGPIAVLINGVALFNPKDGFSFNDQGKQINYKKKFILLMKG